MPNDPAQLAALQQRLGYAFRSPALLLEAVTHGSFMQEQAERTVHNQRLEFLGDSVLHFVLTDALFHEYPGEREGVLSRRRAVLSKGASLTQLARDLGLDACLVLSQSEEDAGGRQRASILGDACEALIGALYLDSDLATVRRLVLGWFGPLSARLALTEDAENPKGRLQELVQPKLGNDALHYDVTGTAGPRHARVFSVAVFLNGVQLGAGRGSSKKAAEEAAAAAALSALRKSGGELKQIEL
ncbi:MAG: ribonuclease III [Opitutae bacterium]|nr:ribonuclease III [Opitutae bacterium]